MRHHRSLLLPLLLLLCAAPAVAGIGISAVCDGGDIQLSVAVFNTEFPAEWTGLIVTRSTIGLCDSEVLITAEPLPVPAELFTEVTIPLTDPAPGPNLYYAYNVFPVDAAGTRLVPIPMGMPGTVAFEACGEAIVTRGTLVVDSYQYQTMRIIECADTCWNVCQGFFVPVTGEQFDALLPYALAATPMDLYGDLWFDSMPSSTCFQSISRFEPSPDGVCGPVPTVEATWDGVKAFYR